MKLMPRTKALPVTAGAATVATALILFGSLEIPWTDPAEAIPPTKHHHHSHAGLTWPPQPRGISNVVIHSSMKDEENDRTIRKARMDHLEQKAKRAVFGLGNRTTRITLINKDEKTDKDDRNIKVSRRRIRIPVRWSTRWPFSVMIGMRRSKWDSMRIERMGTSKFTPASEYQPEVSDEEVAEAAQLARNYFVRQGFKRIAGLRAYGILAYKPDGNGFYDTRVIYVSFHKHDDAPPQLMAWVDLTNQRILQVREEL
ncbi:MAG: hypothetical protein QM706_14795 [Nitrospira sp.]